jgi:hypothetical protein
LDRADEALTRAASAGHRTSVKATNSASGLRLYLLHFVAGCDTARIGDVVAANLRAVVAFFTSRHFGEHRDRALVTYDQDAEILQLSARRSAIDCIDVFPKDADHKGRPEPALVHGAAHR